MAENNTNLFAEILQSFDAGEFFFSLFTGLFYVVALIGTTPSGIQALISPGIDAICVPDYF